MQWQLQMRAVALVGLDDEPLAAGPLRAGAHVGDVAADDEARPPAGLGEHQHQHRRGRRLAVRAGDGERLGLGADRRPASRRGVSTIDARRCRASSSSMLRAGTARRRGDRVDSRARGRGRGRRAPRCRRRADGRGSACSRMSLPLTRVAHLGEDDRDRAHARTADADDVQALRLSDRSSGTCGCRASSARRPARSGRPGAPLRCARPPMARCGGDSSAEPGSGSTPSSVDLGDQAIRREVALFDQHTAP